MGLKSPDPPIRLKISWPSPLSPLDYTSNHAIAGAVLVGSFTLIPCDNINIEKAKQKKNKSKFH